MYSTNISDLSANNTGVTGINQIIIEGNYIFASGSGQIHFGTLDATNHFTSGSGSSISFPTFTDLFYLIIHPTSNKMYVFSKGTSPKLYISSDAYTAFNGSTTFTDITPTLTSASVNWTAFGIAPDGRFFVGGNNNTSKFIAYSDDSGTTYTATTNKQGKATVHDGTNTLYWAVDNEIYYLVDGTSSWVLGYSYPIGTEINCLFYDELLVGT